MTSIEMPKYQCHKKVWALKIKSIVKDGEGENRESNGTAIMTPEDEMYAPIVLDASFVHKHKPQAGGYYVVYEDGYKSFSPAEAFESGYILLSDVVFKSIDALISENNSFISAIPNNLGINLCSVGGIEYCRQADGQLIYLKIVFIPAENGNKPEKEIAQQPDAMAVKTESTFIDRLVAEKQQLEERLQKLEEFIGIPNQKFSSLSDTQRLLLVSQRDAMRTYYGILNARLDTISPDLIPELQHENVHTADSKPIELKLHAPARYSLAECLAELKFGRTASDQQFLQECIEKLQTNCESDDCCKSSEE